MRRIVGDWAALVITMTTSLIIGFTIYTQVNNLHYRLSRSYPWFDKHDRTFSNNSHIRKDLGRKQNDIQRHVMDFQGHDNGSRITLSGNNTTNQRDGDLSWKQSEMKDLSNLIQKRLHLLQNPPDCSKAKKILCKFNRRSGLGAYIHHLSFCMIMAYGTGRTLILESKRWMYTKEGWEKFFLPLSETCLDRKEQNTSMWATPDENEKSQVLELPIITRVHRTLRPEFLPLAIPEDIAERLRRVHGNPVLWWIGEILTYGMRHQPHIQEFIENKMASMGFTHPIVGIHVRRTDKLIREAKFHDIKEYMDHAEEFYEDLEKKQGKLKERRIFLATDEVGLLEEARKKYPGYVFVSDNKVSQSANLTTRYLDDSLKGIIADIHLLATSDFLVCTFSSNVGRLAYELMQHYHADASNKARSVDKVYFWLGQNEKLSGKVAKMPIYEFS